MSEQKKTFDSGCEEANGRAINGSVEEEQIEHVDGGRILGPRGVGPKHSRCANASAGDVAISQYNTYLQGY